MEKKPNKRALRVTLAVRVTPAMRKAFTSTARRAGYTPSEVLRDFVGAYTDGRVTVNKEHSQ